MENLFRLVDCGTTIPFWNFALRGSHVFEPSPGYHMWDDYGGFGSTKTNVKNGFCLETGPFKFPQWRLPESFVNKLDNGFRFKCLCDADAKNIPLHDKCLKSLQETFNKTCITRRVTDYNKFISFDVIDQTLNGETTTFRHLQGLLINCHAVIHNNLGKLVIFQKIELINKFSSVNPLKSAALK